MPQPATQRASDRWLSIVLSVLLHGALLAALVYGWLLYRQPPPPKPTLAIEARVVDSRAVQGAMTPPKPAPPAPPPPSPPPEASGPPEPTPEEMAQREAQRKQAADAAAAEQRAAEEKAAQQKAAEEAAKRAEAERKAKQAAEAQKRAQEQKQAEAQQRQADAQARADLQKSLVAEEQANAARAAGPALANWQAQIAAKITRAWIRPPTARSGIECMLNVTQVPGGEVTQVTIGQCNGDQAVRESIEAAVYRASPLPPPPDPSLFDRNLRIDFKPD